MKNISAVLLGMIPLASPAAVSPELGADAGLPDSRSTSTSAYADPVLNARLAHARERLRELAGVQSGTGNAVFVAQWIKCSGGGWSKC